MRIGVAGLGFMGAMHLTAWRSVAGVAVAAVMSSDAAKLRGDLGAVGGNLPGTQTQFDFSNTACYTDFAKMLADDSLDAIDICLPTNLHAEYAIAALRAGKHVFLEKPLALSKSDADRVLEAQRTGGGTFMVGHVLRFLPEYAAVAKMLAALSPVRSALFRRRCAAPTWSGWLTDLSKSGGALLDLLIHDVDYCVSLWGMPVALRCSGHQDMKHGIDVCHLELQYAGMGPVLITGGWHHPKSYPFAMEFTVVTDEGTLDWKSGGQLMQYADTGEEHAVAVEQQDLFAAELAYFAECVKSGHAPERCPPVQSAQAVELAELAGISRASGGKTISCRSV